MPIYSHHPRFRAGDELWLEFDAQAGELQWWLNGVAQPPVSGIFPASTSVSALPVMSFCVGSRGSGARWSVLPKRGAAVSMSRRTSFEAVVRRRRSSAIEGKEQRKHEARLSATNAP